MPELPPRDRRFACVSCGADVAFAPGTNALACPYCGAHNEITVDAEGVDELDYAGHLERMGEQAEGEEVIVTPCDTCGARVEFPERVTSHNCPFCGSAVVATGRAMTHIKPGAILPFALPRDKAKAAYQAWKKKLWFAPGDLKKASRLESRLNGVYLPYWTYDATAITDYTGQRGEYYYVTVSYTDAQGRSRTRRERRTRWYPARGRVRDSFDDLLGVATTSIERERLREREPWDLSAGVPYDDAYLAGFRAEHYAIDLPAGFARSNELMLPQIRGTIRADIGGDTQRIGSMDSTYHAITFKHLLLPVWIATYRYRDTLYQVLINARTGEVVGQRPYSWMKISLLVIVGLLVLAGIVLAIVSQQHR